MLLIAAVAAAIAARSGKFTAAALGHGEAVRVLVLRCGLEQRVFLFKK
jgi:hypothetical protein